MNSIELLVVLAVFVGIALYGIWKYSKAETNSYNRFVDKVVIQDRQLQKLEAEHHAKLAQMTSLMMKVDDVVAKLACFEKDVEDYQEHLCKIQDSLLDLRDRSFPRKIELDLTHKGPIQFEIFPPTKPKKTKSKK